MPALGESTHHVHDDPPPYNDHEAPPGDNVTPIRDHHAPAPHIEAEKALLAALLVEPGNYPRAAETITSDDFDEPRHQLIWDAMTTVWERDAVPPDHTLLRGELHRAGNTAKTHTLLVDLATNGANPNAIGAYTRDVHEAADRRRISLKVRAAAAHIDQATPATWHQALGRAMDELDAAVNFTTGPGAHLHIPTLDELLAGEDDEYDWVIPGLLEHQERVILTAEPGAGKSVLLRQFAVCASSGIHPFTLQPIKPVRVLHVDVENSVKQSRRHYRPLRIQAGDRHQPDNLRVEIRVQGIDLTQAADQAWLARAVRSAQPDILCIGPIYKLANGDPTEEKSAKPVAMALDQIRADHGCALLLEAHAAKASVTGSRNRKPPMEPYGWSGWMRWPEIGIWLNKDGGLKHWRGAREERDWPTALRRGGHWPWTPETTKADERWVAMQKARREAGHPIGLKLLAKATGIPQSSLHDLIKPGGRLADAWNGYNQSSHPGDGKRQEDE